MIGHRDASSALTLLVLLTGTSILHLSGSSPVDDPRGSAGLPAPGDEDVRGRDRREGGGPSMEKREEEDELFKDVDPKTLAAVLLEALNHSRVERRREEVREEEEERMDREEEEERVDRADRDRDGRQELEMLMAAQGKEQEEQEEERKKAQEEEEKMTERVTSRTTSQTVPVQMPPPQEDEEAAGDGRAGGEEQLSPEELKSLETMMKEFPRLNGAAKRDGDSEQNRRPSRGGGNMVAPSNKGGTSLAMSKKKLKWQEETQKAMNFPFFRGGNFMDEFEDSSYRNAAQPPQKEETEEDKPEEEEEEEVLSPEEEEAQAKAEQEELRRQAAEAQRAKLEEEKLADIASDMLLRYMVKQSNGNRKYNSALFNAAEDKRSDEELAVAEEDDVIDPQTIDKLIEISSKLHLPADDVVEIISDVEKKKKKDAPPQATHLSATPVQASQNGFSVSKQPSPVGVLKTWFQEKPPKPQDLWSKTTKLPNLNLWPKPQKVVSVKQDPWFKSAKSAWSGYPPPPYRYPPYYQRKPDYYPIYVPPPPRPKLRYYVPKPVYALDGFLRNTVDDAYAFPPKRRYHGWVQPRLRKPPVGLHQTPYYSSYGVPLYPRTYPRPRPVSRTKVPPWQNPFYYPGNQGFYGKQPDVGGEDLEKFIQQVLRKPPVMSD